MVDFRNILMHSFSITERCLVDSMEWRIPMEDFNILEIGKVSEETEGNPVRDLEGFDPNSSS